MATELHGVGPNLSTEGGASIIWIYGKEFTTGMTVTVRAYVGTWSGRVTGDIKSGENGFQKARVVLTSFTRSSDGEDEKEDPRSDDDFAAITVTVSSAQHVDAAMIDGP